MSNLSRSIEEVIVELKKFPTVGEKSATRFAYFLMKQPKSEVKKLINAIISLKKSVNLCTRCNNLDSTDPCSICKDVKRDDSQLCIVESSIDLRAIEKTEKYRGKYFVLHGVISPLDGTTPKDLMLDKMLNLIKEHSVKEVILATNPRAKGETTANYIKSLLKGRKVKVSRLAYGIPVGSELEYIDSLSLARSLEGRRNF
ncbi:recombination mediator RecR [Thermodesulfobacteriota bacterium]